MGLVLFSHLCSGLSFMQEIWPVNIFTFGNEILNFLFELRPNVKWLQPTGDVFDLPMYY